MKLVSVRTRVFACISLLHALLRICQRGMPWAGARVPHHPCVHCAGSCVLCLAPLTSMVAVKSSSGSTIGGRGGMSRSPSTSFLPLMLARAASALCPSATMGDIGVSRGGPGSGRIIDDGECTGLEVPAGGGAEPTLLPGKARDEAARTVDMGDTRRCCLWSRCRGSSCRVVRTLAERMQKLACWLAGWLSGAAFGALGVRRGAVGPPGQSPADPSTSEADRPE
jgi:hypothetical protein